MKIHLMINAIPFLFFLSLYPRSPFRTPDPKAPQVTAQWKHAPQSSVTVYDNHFRQYPLFTYGTKDIQADLIPEVIPYADQSGFIDRETINTLIEHALHEISTKKRKIRKTKELTDFTVLQYKNFSFRRGCGLIVLKFKDHPLVLKLFIEKPETFLNPYIKGMEPIFFHYMAGGVNRHVSGLTRAKNLKLIRSIINSDSLWGKHIYFPRKWYWLPKDNKEIELTGKNIADQEIKQYFPGTYAIIADYINTENQINLPLKLRKKMVMQFSNDISTYLDPHFNNFVFHADIIDGKETYKITIIDTEHFPTIVGLEQSKNFKSHFNWYAHLTGKCINDIYCKTKRDLKAQRTIQSPLCLNNPIFYQKEL